jgi:hypothetical protein
MSSHGALDTETKEYVLPSRASKGRSYVCADCSQRVIFRSGDIRVPHFAHFTPTTKCRYYEGSSGESENHKHAKLVLQSWLSAKRPIEFSWSCGNQVKFGACGTSDGSTSHRVEYKDGDQVVLEYRDPHGKYIADVAIINDGTIRYIIEVVHSHRTSTSCRPEPWFEVKANDIDEGSHYQEPIVFLENCRLYEKRYCANCSVTQASWAKGIPILLKRYGQERGWRQDKPCLCCKRDTYNPEWVANRPRQACKICVGARPEELQKIVNDLIWS